VVTYNFNFTTITGSLTPTGTFTIDRLTAAFTAFEIDWNGIVLTRAGIPVGFSDELLYTQLADYPFNYFWFASNSSNFTSVRFILLNTESTVYYDDWRTELSMSPGQAQDADGLLTTTLVAATAPEPSTIFMHLGGATLLAAKRRIKIARGLNRTAQH
jgi:hypothetical protein